MNESTWGNGEMILTEQNRGSHRKTLFFAILPIVNPTWTGLAPKARLRGERPATYTECVTNTVTVDDKSRR
jgi:hypothetical protein